MLIFSLCHKM